MGFQQVDGFAHIALQDGLENISMFLRCVAYPNALRLDNARYRCSLSANCWQNPISGRDPQLLISRR